MHPSHILDPEDMALVNYWRVFNAAEGGSGPLPFSGGLAEQPACMLDAFDIIGAAFAALKPRAGGS